MTMNWKDIARATLEGAEAETMTFPRPSASSWRPLRWLRRRLPPRHPHLLSAGGEALELPAEPTAVPVAERFDAARLKAAIREAPGPGAGLHLQGLLRQGRRGGLRRLPGLHPGKRVLYWGRTGETHTEYFPGTQQRRRVSISPTPPDQGCRRVVRSRSLAIRPARPDGCVEIYYTTISISASRGSVFFADSKTAPVFSRNADILTGLFVFWFQSFNTNGPLG